MNNNNLIILAVLGIGGYLAYTQFKKRKEAQFRDTNPTLQVVVPVGRNNCHSMKF
jgi:predicted negative regulator of RcsB-dependent stress response